MPTRNKFLYCPLGIYVYLCVMLRQPVLTDGKNAVSEWKMAQTMPSVRVFSYSGILVSQSEL